MSLLWIAAAIALVVVGGMWLARAPVLQGRFLPELRWLFASLAPPDDYFAPLVSAPISLAQAGETGMLKFRHKYVGTYQLGLVAAKPEPQGLPSQRAKFRLSIHCAAGGHPPFERQIDGYTAPWWSRSEGGFTLLNYEVPGNLPVDRDIECLIRVESTDSGFEQRYGPLSVFVRKASEK